MTVNLQDQFEALRRAENEIRAMIQEEQEQYTYIAHEQDLRMEIETKRAVQEVSTHYALPERQQEIQKQIAFHIQPV
eukprot:117365-Pyramimonas_sp.AAC.1